MKKVNILIPLIIATTSISVLKVSAQEDINVTIKELQSRLQYIDSLEYSKSYSNIRTALELTSELNETYFFIKGDIETASIYNKLAQVNNPTSDVLGFLNFQMLF